MPEPSQVDYRQHLELETPEHVVLDYEIAGVGSRAAAAIADWFLIFLLIIVAAIGFGLLGTAGHLARTWGGVVFVLMFYLLQLGYFALFEGLREGQTPGKRWLGIRTIRETGHGVTFADAAARSLLMPIDLLGMIGIILIAVHPKGRRLGDLVAGTVVVRDQPVQVRAAAASARGPMGADADLGTPRLNDAEFQLVREFVGRAEALPVAVRDRFAAQLMARFAERNPDRPADNYEFIRQLHEDELARRRGRFGGRSGAGIGPRTGSSVAERLIARKSARWGEFQVLAERVTRSGLDSLSAAELPEFAARYREVSADLARARVYRADRVVLAQLERLVAAGHSALYRDERQTWGRIWHFVSRDCPAGVIRSWRYVALSYLVLLVSIGSGFALLRERPSLAQELIPDAMLERAEAGAARIARGEGFVEVSGELRPLTAVEIMMNNIRVSFTCFAAGIVFGIGALFMVGYNGVMLGTIAGHFANVGMSAYLWTFVVGHGVLELSAICFAGAAGLMLGKALIAPGDLSRGDALTIAGRSAMQLVGSAVVLLVIAGTIEGMVSTSAMPAAGRIAISAGSALFLVIYLANGTRETREERRET
jgi:uncharacterized membrane protein SpoIIM required for sporulation/uncharacterized RDD family membrane protein YckC